jgi:SAM-dependent methyltransferase
LQTQNKKITANAYITALSVWKTIIDPITEDQITGKISVETRDITYNEDTYYSRDANSVRQTVAMTKFHNSWVKAKCLIQKIPNVFSLFDMSCGKAGDLSKWINAGITTAIGVDISEDNIQNNVDGAYKRLDDEKFKRRIGLNNNFAFLPMDSSRPYVDQIEGINNPFMQNLAKTMWGQAAEKVESIAHLKGIMSGATFDIASCQFSIHYFFENEQKLNGFISNLNSVLKPGGYFIGTCFDGQEVDNLLKDNDTVTGSKENTTIWSITKQYSKYKDNAYGQTIKVFVETINKTHDEFLVPYKLLVEKLANSGIHLLTAKECADIGIEGGSSSGLFDELFRNMIDSNKDVIISDKVTHSNNPIKIASKMLDCKDEMTFSFLNRWFIFKKTFGKVVKKKK